MAAVFLTCILAIFIPLLIGHAARQHEPSFGGKPLSYWTQKLLFDEQLMDAATLQRAPAYYEDLKAIRAMGSNAVPYLLLKLSVRESGIQRTASRFSGKIGVQMKSAENEREEAIRAFTALGDQGDIAVPALTQMLQNGDVIDIQSGLKALTGIGRAAEPSLRYANTFIFHPELSADALHLISSVGPNATAALPALKGAIESDNVSLRLSALSVLTDLGRNAAPLLPQVLRCLDDPNRGVANNALNVVNAAEVASPEVKEALLRAMRGTNGLNTQSIFTILTNLFPEFRR